MAAGCGDLDGATREGLAGDIGEVRMRDRVIPDVDLPALRARAQASAGRIWNGWQSSDALGRSAGQMSPWSFGSSCEHGCEADR